MKKKNNLKLRKINARWIPHLLSYEQKSHSVENAKKLSKLYPKYTTKTFDNLVTGDETWIYYLEPNGRVITESEHQRMQKRPIITKRLGTVNNVLYVIFFDNTCCVMQIPVPKDKTVTYYFYKNIVFKKTEEIHVSRKSWPKMGMKYLRLLQDNAL